MVEIMTRASKKQLQSLLGTLQHISCCVRAGRIFLNRMLNTLRGNYETQGYFPLDSEFQQDVHWWHTFMHEFNGVSLMAELEWSQSDRVFASDACLQGMGAISLTLGRYWHSPIPGRFRHLHINALELLAIVVCLRLWSHEFGGKKIVCLCDNMCSVTLINTSRSRDSFMQACLREICYLGARNSFELSAEHISGVDNRLADHLSRWEVADKHREQFEGSTNQCHFDEDNVTDGVLNFSHPW